MRNKALIAITAAAVLSASSPRPAHACGGCFAPPGAVQSVTDHRMVLSLGTSQTTLWDQFQYAGNPADFSWILPIRYSAEVRVRMADNSFMTYADNITAPVLNAPSRPSPPYCGGGRDYAFGADASASRDGGVTVHREEVVGPYQVAIIGSEDPMALRTWLADNGYAVPPAVVPVIDYYVARRLDFIALRLRPGEGVNRMIPVRVTVPGYAPTLPLRMIAAGITDRVGLTLTVIAQSRVEAMNFPNGEVTESDLTYDFNNPTNPATDFRAQFDRINTANGNRAWITESSMASSLYQWTRALQFVPRTTFNTTADGGAPDAGGGGGLDGGGAPDDAGDVDASDLDGGEADAGEVDGGEVDAGGMDPSAQPDPIEDARIAFEGIGETAVVTRLRASLSADALDRDLVLQASAGGVRNRTYSYGTVLNRPGEYPPCSTRALANPAGCAATPGARGGWWAGAALLGIAATAATRRRRKN